MTTKIATKLTMEMTPTMTTTMSAGATAFDCEWFDPVLDESALDIPAPRLAPALRQLPVVPYPAGSQATGNHRPARAPDRPGASLWVRAATLLVGVVAVSLLYFTSGADAGGPPPQTVLHVVQPGDTLWTLATRFTPSGGDVRDTVWAIRVTNTMSSSMLQVGEQIEIPTSG